VSGVEYKNGEIMLQAGGLELALSNLVRIAPANTLASSGTTPAANPPSRREDGPLGQPIIPVLPDGFTFSTGHYSN